MRLGASGAADRRADISASMPARKILCKIKRDYRSDVWTTPYRHRNILRPQGPLRHAFRERLEGPGVVDGVGWRGQPHHPLEAWQRLFHLWSSSIRCDVERAHATMKLVRH